MITGVPRDLQTESLHPTMETTSNRTDNLDHPLQADGFKTWLYWLLAYYSGIYGIAIPPIHFGHDYGVFPRSL